MSVSTQRGLIVEGSQLARFKMMFDYGPKIGHPTITLDYNTVMNECVEFLLSSPHDELAPEELEYCHKWRDYALAGFPVVQQSPTDNAQPAEE
jgi:hypothetical protein